MHIYILLLHILDRLLRVELTRVPEFHSHLEGLTLIDPKQLKNQVQNSQSLKSSLPHLTSSLLL